MNAGNIIGLVIISISALIMLLIGIFQFHKKDEPVGFYNLIDPPKKNEITDIILWNKQHGIIWICYGVCIEIGFLLGIFSSLEILQIIFMVGGLVVPLPIMIIRHQILVKKYQKNYKSR